MPRFSVVETFTVWHTSFGRTCFTLGITLWEKNSQPLIQHCIFPWQPLCHWCIIVYFHENLYLIKGRKQKGWRLFVYEAVQISSVSLESLLWKQLSTYENLTAVVGLWSSWSVDIWFSMSLVFVWKSLRLKRVEGGNCWLLATVVPSRLATGFMEVTHVGCTRYIIYIKLRDTNNLHCECSGTSPLVIGLCLFSMCSISKMLWN